MDTRRKPTLAELEAILASDGNAPPVTVNPDGSIGVSRATEFLSWAAQTFGDIAYAPRERAMRFAEEAIELAHAMQLPRAVVDTMVARVYARSSGDIPREIGQSLATLEMLAVAMGIDADAEATKEFHRVQSIPKEEWARRHGAKVAIGIAT